MRVFRKDIKGNTGITFSLGTDLQLPGFLIQALNWMPMRLDSLLSKEQPEWISISMQLNFICDDDCSTI